GSTPSRATAGAGSSWGRTTTGASGSGWSRWGGRCWPSSRGGTSRRRSPPARSPSSRASPPEAWPRRGSRGSGGDEAEGLLRRAEHGVDVLGAELVVGDDADARPVGAPDLDPPLGEPGDELPGVQPRLVDVQEEDVRLHRSGVDADPGE